MTVGSASYLKLLFDAPICIRPSWFPLLLACVGTLPNDPFTKQHPEQTMVASLGREGVVWISHTRLRNRPMFLVGRFQNSSHSWRIPFRTKHHLGSWGSEKSETSSRDFFIVLSGLLGAFEAFLERLREVTLHRRRTWKALSNVSWNNPSFLGQPRFFSERKQPLGGRQGTSQEQQSKILNNLNGWTQITRTELNSNNQNRAQQFP